MLHKIYLFIQVIPPPPGPPPPPGFSIDTGIVLLAVAGIIYGCYINGLSYKRKKILY